MAEERYSTDAGEEDIERVRLSMLAAACDPKTFALLERVGIGPGMHVLELGAGAGTVSAWMAEQVGPDGRVMSTDIDLQFHEDMPDNVIVRQHDVENETLPAAHFDIVHARAVLQHVPSRAEVIEKLLAALKPGGWLVLEDGQFMGFGEQSLPEPYATIHKIIASGSMNEWHDPNYGLHILGRLRELGCTDLDVIGEVWAMRPGEAGGEWWFLALERAFPRLVEVGMVTQEDADTALAQVREPGFAMISTTSIATIGRKPV
ncbi:MAG: methyltransferase domain-containing protein [Acidimicrobiales bacterium]|jgi:SAM-dependent methyltransferase|nr:methyltransferase domain-containing protein [Acidimicrobiales bacterium]